MKFTHHVFIFCAASLLFLPSLLFGPSGVDLATQSLWVHNFEQQLYAGEAYPRWLMDMTAGHGSPVFFFYPPLAYYLTALLGFLQSYGDFGYLQLTASAWLAVLVSGYGFYFWMRSEGATNDGAVAGSLLYMASPVSICVNFYQLMLFSSLWIYAWVPFVLMFSRRLAKGNGHALPGYTLSVACLMLTNAPMTIVGGIAIGIIVLMGLRRNNWLRLILYFGAGSLLAAGLTCIYWMPAWEFERFANLNLHWFKFIHWTDYKDMHISRPLLWVDYVALALFLAACCRNKMADRCALVMGIAGLVLLLPFGDWMWTHVPIFVFMQTSDRLFLLPAVAVCWLAATSAWPRLRMVTYLLTAASCAAAFVIAHMEHYSLEDYVRDEPVKFQMYKLSMDNYATYLPGKDAFYYFGAPERIKALSENNPPVINVYGDAEVTVKEWKPREIILDYTAAEPSRVILRRLYFPGLYATYDGGDIDLERDREAGRVELALPRGHHEVTVELLRLLPETLGAKISFFSLCLLFLLTLLQRRKPQLTPL